MTLDRAGVPARLLQVEIVEVVRADPAGQLARRRGREVFGQLATELGLEEAQPPVGAGQEEGGGISVPLLANAHGGQTGREVVVSSFW